jgi:hypothetical protein
VVSLWFHCGFIVVSLGFHWGFIGVSLGFHWGFIGLSLGFHWGFIGVSLGFHWGFIGVSLGFHWGFIGVSLGFLPGLNSGFRKLFNQNIREFMERHRKENSHSPAVCSDADTIVFPLLQVRPTRGFLVVIL